MSFYVTIISRTRKTQLKKCLIYKLDKLTTYSRPLIFYNNIEITDKQFKKIIISIKKSVKKTLIITTNVILNIEVRIMDMDLMLVRLFLKVRN